ncbi:hypothetical protein [Caulobacter zeae]|nr:hypothetical protein [Caulobacter zeae]
MNTYVVNLYFAKDGVGAPDKTISVDAATPEQALAIASAQNPDYRTIALP